MPTVEKWQPLASNGDAMKTTSIIAVLGATALLGCAATPSVSMEEVAAVLKSSFSERGPAKLDRLDQTELQRVCSQAAESGKGLPDDVRSRIQSAVQASIKYPADGKFIGDWREGEKIAQNGRGLQFSDAVGGLNGANCYACHQLSPQEISYGNQGPSLFHYGVNRGVRDPNSAESEPIVRYTWARIWNTHAFNACSGMPRFGDAGILTQAQIRDVMALLLAPDSPVNK